MRVEPAGDRPGAHAQRLAPERRELAAHGAQGREPLDAGPAVAERHALQQRPRGPYLHRRQQLLGEALVGLKDGEWSRDYLEPEKSIAQQLLSSVQVWGARTLLKGVSLGDGGVDIEKLAALRAVRSEFSPLEREALRMRAGAVPGRLYAHCFCTPY